MSKIKSLLLILIIVLPLFGCVSIKRNKTSSSSIPEDGGFYSLGKDRNGNYVWSQKAYLATTTPQKPNFKRADILRMVIDPQDEMAIYIGTKEDGMYYTYDAGENWFQPEKFRKGRINAINVSYKNKCLIYVATDSELYRSSDCNRTWTLIYNETRADKDYYISALAVDSYNEGIVYMGISVNPNSGKKEKGEGEVNKSSDFGESWQPDKQLRTPIGSIVSKIVVNPQDTRIVYVATNNAGIFRTIDGGEEWEDITGEPQKAPRKNSKEAKEFERRFEKLIDFTADIYSKKIRDSLVFRDLAIIPDENNSLIYASNYGLLKSSDMGNTWEKIELIPPEGEEKAIIYSLGIHPENDKEFYYGTDDTIFKTVDGGESWTTIKGPGTRAIYNIIVTPNDSGETNVYVGTYNLKPQAEKK